jgi:hypothetical protein
MTGSDRTGADRLRLVTKQTPLDLAPRNAYEALTRAQVEDLEKRVAELSGRVNGLIWSIVALVVLTLIERVL